MKYGYIVNDGSNTDIYYHSGNSVIKRSITGDTRGRAECILSDVRSRFSVSVMRGERVIVYRTSAGDVMLAAGGTNRLIQHGSGRGDIYLSAITGDERMRLIYVNNGSLVTQSTDAAGGSDAVRLDEVSGNEPYRLVPVAKGCYLLMYNRCGSEKLFGMREVTASAVGGFKGIYTTAFDIGDCSACADDNAIHIVFTSASRFAVRVMYVKRTSEGFGRPVNLWEGSRCGNVCTAVCGGEVYVWWESGSVIFESRSDNGGESFGRFVRRSKAAGLFKAMYIGMENRGIGEVLLGENGDIYAPESVKEQMSEGVRTSLPHEESGINETVRELREELAKKQEEIERLTHTLRSHNSESGKRESELRSRNRELRAELERIKNAGVKGEENTAEG